MSNEGRRRWTSSTFMRYLRFQLPATVVVATALAAAVHHGLVARETAAIVVLLWVAKDLALYPLLRRSYELGTNGYPSQLIGRSATARQDLAPRGYVLVAGELWRAEAVSEDRPIRAGESVVVTGIVGTLLVVRRAQGADVERST